MLEANKQLVRRLVEAMGHRDLGVLAEIAEGEFAATAKAWVSPFQGSFPDFTMRLVSLVAEGDQVVAHFRCTGTHEGQWLGRPATGRRFEEIDEIYIFTVTDGKLSRAIGVEDNLTRLQQLGML